MKKKTMISLTVLFMIALLMPSLVFANGQQDSEANGKADYRIGMAVCTLGEAYWEADIAGMRDAAKDYNVDLKIQSAQNNINDQIKQIENFIAMDVDAIICAPVDVKAISQSVKKCNDVGIPFIFNSRVTLSTDTATVDYGVGYNMEGLAALGAQELVDYAKENNTKIKVIEVLGALTDSHTIYCRDGFGKVVKANSEYVEIVAQVPGDWVPDKAMASAINALKAHPEANCIYYHSDFYFPAIQSALKQADKWAKIGEDNHVITICPGGEKNTLDAMRDGYVDYILVFPNLETGYISLERTVQMLEGKKFGDEYYLMDSYILTPENFDEKSGNVYGYVWSPS